MASSSLLRAREGFTLIELLVVVLIIGVLIAVSAPAFLSQAGKAQDSAAKQMLAVAYKSARSASIDNSPQGAWTDATHDLTALATSINASEPELNAQNQAGAPGAVKTAGRSNVNLSLNGSSLLLVDLSDSGNVCSLSAPQNGAIVAPTCTSAAQAGVTVPTNSGAPSISGSPLAAGTTLTASPGTWTGNPSFSYQWQSSPDGSTWSNIIGATSSSYTLQSADAGNQVRVQVTGTNAAGSLVAYSAPVSVLAPPTNVSAPTVPASPQQGVAQTATNGSWTNSPTAYSYQWLSCTDSSSTSSCANATGSGATSQTYTPIAADVSQYLRVQVTAQNVAGSSSAAVSGASGSVIGLTPQNTAAPAIGTNAATAYGDTLGAGTNGSWTPTPGSAGTNYSYTYQWQRCSSATTSTCSDIAGATSSSYTISWTDATGNSGSGYYLRVGVTAHNAGATSAPAYTDPPVQATTNANLLSDSSFENSSLPAGWTGTNTLSRSGNWYTDYNGYTGNDALVMSGTISSNNWLINGPCTPVTAGFTYSVRADVYTNTAAYNGFKVGLRYYTDASACSADNVRIGDFGTSYYTSASTTYAGLGVSGLAPSGTTYARIYVVSNNDSGSQSYTTYVDSTMLVRGPLPPQASSFCVSVGGGSCNATTPPSVGYYR